MVVLVSAVYWHLSQLKMHRYNMKFSKIIISASLLSSLHAASVLAADVEAGVVKNDLASFAPAFTGEVTLSQFSTAVGAPLSSAEGLSSQDRKSSDAKVSAVAAATVTGISYFEVGTVYSTTYGGYEGISSSQFSTANNHGGSQLFIYVWQFGYGNPNNATMNGISKSPGLSQVRCGLDLHVCSAGETVTGWLYGWDYSGQSAGNFTVSANSIANPFGYWSDSIYIQ